VVVDVYPNMRSFMDLLSDEDIHRIAKEADLSFEHVAHMDDVELAALYDIPIDDLPFYVLTNERLEELDAELTAWIESDPWEEEEDLDDNLYEGPAAKDVIDLHRYVAERNQPAPKTQFIKSNKWGAPIVVQHHFEIVE
jgi:hypothetical protein